MMDAPAAVVDRTLSPRARVLAYCVQEELLGVKERAVSFSGTVAAEVREREAARRRETKTSFIVGREVLASIGMEPVLVKYEREKMW